jgi:hypothetical protein
MTVSEAVEAGFDFTCIAEMIERGELKDDD